MKGYLDGELGMISIDSEVIARYAGSTAVECFGIVGMAAVSMKDGLVKLLKGRLTGTYIYIDSYILIIADRRKVCHLPLYRRNGGKLWQPIQ